ncbi:MAG TPA: lysophospholipid acyltransferase family protein [Longimicrobiales bacterium]|nr:lysophospholipid acyltransferase family protein [Longimicrobiales bacterium]
MHELEPLDRKITLKHRLEYAGFAAVVRLAESLSPNAARKLGESLGMLGHSGLRIRRELVERNLRAAFPEATDEWVHDIAKRAYEHLGRETLVSIRLGNLTPKQLIEMTTDPGIDEFRKAMAEGKGAVVMSGHVGNHEIAAAALAARGFPVDVVVQRQGNPLFDKALNDARMKHGLGVIDRSKAQRQALKSLRAGRAVAFAADQDAGRNGVFVPFFGRRASTHRGPALFAVKTGAPAFIGAALQSGNGYRGFLERLEVDRAGPVDDVVYNLMAAFTKRLEEVVRSAPDQYLWMHRRWKTTPP